MSRGDVSNEDHPTDRPYSALSVLALLRERAERFRLGPYLEAQERFQRELGIQGAPVP